MSLGILMPSPGKPAHFFHKSKIPSSTTLGSTLSKTIFHILEASIFGFYLPQPLALQSYLKTSRLNFDNLVAIEYSISIS